MNWQHKKGCCVDLFNGLIDWIGLVGLVLLPWDLEELGAKYIPLPYRRSEFHRLPPGPFPTLVNQ